MAYPKSYAHDLEFRQALAQVPDAGLLKQLLETTAAEEILRHPKIQSAEEALSSLVEFATGPRQPEHHDMLDQVIEKLMRVHARELLQQK